MNKYIYKTNFDHTVVIKPTTYQAVSDPVSGQVIHYLSTKPIKMRFEGCHCIIDETFAKEHNVSLDGLVKLIEGNKGFGIDFHLAVSPDKVPTKEEIKEIEDSGKNKTEVIQGVRGTRGGKNR